MSKILPTYLTISNDTSFDLSKEISELNADKVGLLVDENTRQHCLPLANSFFDLTIEIASGEQHKNIATCEHIWQELTKANFTRKSVLVNMGGGVIGDMGGFAAATYKRGIRFINVPTTLLSQVDASIGGKLGVDFGNLKNHVGLFKNPDRVIVHSKFLKTLPERELKSGYAEIIKHALIHDKAQWDMLKQSSFAALNWNDIIPKSISIKNNIVEQDPLESGLRKILNFGHTLGHAIESHLLHSMEPLLHGEAVAIGMILETHLSVLKGWLSPEDGSEISSYLLRVYDLPSFLPPFDDLTHYLKQDKKNKGDVISFSLLKEIGKGNFDQEISDEMIRASLDHYHQINRES